MVRHVILWTLKEDLTEEQKQGIKESAKEQLEGLYGKIPALKRIQIHIHPLDSSNCDMMLESVFESTRGLAEYSVHPAHVEVADTYVRPYTKSRVCMDFEV